MQNSKKLKIIKQFKHFCKTNIVITNIVFLLEKVAIFLSPKPGRK